MESSILTSRTVPLDRASNGSPAAGSRRVCKWNLRTAPAATRTGATAGFGRGAALASRLTKHRTAAKEWRMGWAFLLGKTGATQIILDLRGETVNAKGCIE